MFADGFPLPAPLTPIDLPLPLSWKDLDLFSASTFSNSPFHQPIEFDYETMTPDPTATSSDVVHTPSEDDNSQSDAMIFADHQPDVHIHEELHWRQALREDLLDACQKKSLKILLPNSPWDSPIKLGKLIYAGYLLVGLPTNPFTIHEVDSRWMITTSFLRALHLDLQMYEQLRTELCRCSPRTLNVITNDVISNSTQRCWEPDCCWMGIFTRKGTLALMLSFDSLLNVMDSSWMFSLILLPS